MWKWRRFEVRDEEIAGIEEKVLTPKDLPWGELSSPCVISLNYGTRVERNRNWVAIMLLSSFCKISNYGFIKKCHRIIYIFLLRCCRTSCDKWFILLCGKVARDGKYMFTKWLWKVIQWHHVHSSSPGWSYRDFWKGRYNQFNGTCILVVLYLNQLRALVWHFMCVGWTI